MSDYQFARYAWGTFVGGVVGFVVGKVYLIWAILFNEQGRRLDEQFWNTIHPVSSPPAYEWAPAHNIGFMFLMIALFACLGLLFTTTLVPLRRHASESADEASVQNLQ